MSVLNLSQIVGGSQRNLYQLGERVRSAVSDISKAADSSVNTTQDSATISSQRMQARATGFREAVQDIAKNVSELSLAARGSEDIAGKLAELEAISLQASQEPADEKSLQKFGAAVKKIRAEIDNIASQSKFADTAATADKKPGATAAKAEPQQIQLNSNALLGAEKEITSLSDIRNMITTVQNASGKLAAVQDDIKSMFESYEMMAVHLEISMENQIAASSVLPTDSDLNPLQLLLGNPNQAGAAQTGKLPTDLLNLI